MTQSTATDLSYGQDDTTRMDQILARATLPDAPLVMTRQVLEGAPLRVGALVASILPLGRIARSR